MRSVAPRFEDRRDAGRELAERLLSWAGRPDVLVLALPRGGVPIGFEVAKALRAPLDVFVVRKLGVPYQPELAMGAIAMGGTRVLNQYVIDAAEVSEEELEKVVEEETERLEQRARAYRGDRPPPDVKGKTVIVVDDGLATGASMRAAAQALRIGPERPDRAGDVGPARVVVAVPVAPSAVVEELRSAADEVIAAYTPEHFMAVGQWYVNFNQTTDDEVRDLLRQAWEAGPEQAD